MPSAVSRIGDWTINTSEAETQRQRDRRNRNDQRRSPEADSDDERWRRNEKFATGKLKRYVILGTALVKLQIGTFITKTFRAICDTGAQAGLIRASVAKENAFPLKQCSRYVYGIGGGNVITRKVQAFIIPWYQSDYRVFTELYLSDEYGGEQPWVSLSSIKPPENLTMADPYFYNPNSLDILLAADVWSEIVGATLYRHIFGAVMHETQLGYVIMGKAWIQEAFNCGIYQALVAPTIEEKPQIDKLDDLFKAFFHAEGTPEEESQWTVEEQMVEDLYKKNVYRKPNGSYVVKLPFKPGKMLGDSRKIAMRRWFALESKLQKNDNLRAKYVEFMREFLTLNHMRKAPPLQSNIKGYYIPHHAIDAKKFRTVFDASCKTSNGESLNSIQMTGPKLQIDIQLQIMRFRRYKYAVSTDVVKMFRQIGLDPTQWDYQRIFWREAPDQPLEEYQVTVVIYGLTASGHAAVRTMIQCANDHENQYPEAAEIIRKCFYMDDGMFGADTIAILKMRCKEVELVLKKGGFDLSKWCSNSIATERYMQGDVSDDKDLGCTEIEAKILGLRWLKSSDEIAIVVKQPNGSITNTKRKILSTIAKLYDPNGLVGPVVVVAKMIMREIWQDKKLDWDKAVPEAIGKQWAEFADGLSGLSDYRVPRWLATSKHSKIQLHGFCDASIKALGACIYVRVIDEEGHIRSTLLASKSKVGKFDDMSIHRVELMAAVLCSKLMSQAMQACEFENAEHFMWSDSIVALSWIKKSPLELKTFTSNRVQAIHKLTKACTWAHVQGQHNPADLLSRGMKVSDFVVSAFWKQGPVWLSGDQRMWPVPKLSITPQIQAEIAKEVKPKAKLVMSVMMLSMNDQFRELWYRSNSWKKVLRITAYVLRFFNNVRMKNRDGWTRGEPKPAELRRAIEFWVKYAQARAYKKEIEILKQKDEQFIAKSQITQLQPYIDNVGMLRVGGRIDKANIDYAKKHPVIIPPKSRLSYLIIQQAHKETMHGSTQLMMAYIRRTYWIPQLRAECRKIIAKCAKCTRFAQKTVQQLMAELPAVRVRPARPFDAVGIDLAGPINIKITDKLNLNTRSKASIPEIKGYIVVFVCMVTRAIHLEPVMDLSAEAFLQAYRRFTARRGFPRKVFSDNGTNLVATERILRQAVENWKQSSVQQFVRWNGTEWHFITPAAPHEGGLWEAAVKSMKHHLRRVVGTQKYSYEGISTLVACIEACLNSRPICALSDDPADLEALTPAHFLIGGPIKLPIAEESDIPPATAKRLLKAIQAQTQAFWESWSEDCLHAMMNRPKWREAQNNLKPGQLVLIKNENLPPTFWAMGRILEVVKAKDGKVRSVKLKLKDSILYRSVRKLCVLPTDDDLDYWVGK